MRSVVKIGAILLSFAVLAGCVTESGNFRKLNWTKDAVAGQTITLVESSDVTANCTTYAVPVARIASGPSNGSTRIRKALVYPAVKKSNPRSRCNSTRINGIVVDYTAKPGFKGTDEVKIHVGFRDGFVDEITVRIRVH